MKTSLLIAKIDGIFSKENIKFTDYKEKITKTDEKNSEVEITIKGIYKKDE